MRFSIKNIRISVFFMHLRSKLTSKICQNVGSLDDKQRKTVSNFFKFQLKIVTLWLKTCEKRCKWSIWTLKISRRRHMNVYKRNDRNITKTMFHIIALNCICFYHSTWQFFEFLTILVLTKKWKKYILKMCTYLKIENYSSWVNFTHCQGKTHHLTLEFIFISSSWRVYMHIKFDC